MATKRFTFRFVGPQYDATGKKSRSAMAAIDIAQMQLLPDEVDFTEAQVGSDFAGHYSRLNQEGNPYISTDGKAVCYFRSERMSTPISVQL